MINSDAGCTATAAYRRTRRKPLGTVLYSWIELDELSQWLIAT